MPGFDGTGPGGRGAMTGGGRGFCTTVINPAEGMGDYGVGRGGFPRGGGRGRLRGGGSRARRFRQYLEPAAGVSRDPFYGAPHAQEMTPQQEADMLKARAKGLQTEIDGINERLGMLKAEADKGQQ